MADVQSNIVVNIDTTAALAELKALQRQISAFHTSMAKTGAAGTAVSANMQQNLLNSINGSGKFYAEMTRIKTTTEAFNTALAKNQFSMKEYFRYAGAATTTFGKLFKQEHETINKVARENVKTLQTQYIKMGRDANGALRGISVRPLALDMNNLQTQTAMAAQKQALLNQLLRQGSTNLLNFGKNTQWAGRQLMVGFTVPLMYFGAMAGKTFMQLEEQAIRFKRVYGDMFTTSADATKALKDVQLLANEFTKYGVAVADTMKMAADVAATGKTGSDLIAQVSNATRLAVLGGIDQQKSLDTIISLTSTFGIAAGDLATNIDFLNAVENQTILNIDDLTTAIPKAAPVVKQLGGNVQDLAFFMTAMREGGIDAAQGANAIKSALASMINPTKAAKDMLAGFGIDVVGLVNADKGNVKKMVLDLATALNTLDPLNRAQAIEKMFGKFQFARVSTLFQNVIQQGSQAQTVLGLTKATTEELAILSERELNKISESPMYKFKKEVQDLKVAIAPIGGEFIKALTPVLKFFGGIFDKFNNLGDGTKKFIVLLTTLLAGIGPLVLMSFGLLANGIANIIKMFVGIKSLFNGVGKSSAGLGEQTNFLTQQQMENAASAASLDQAHQRLQQRFTAEAEAVALLTAAYQESVVAQRAFGMAPMPTGMGKRPPMKMATGGIVSGPGTGKSDSVPVMLSNGEAVVPAANVKKYPALTAGLVAGNIPGFAEGYSPGGTPQYRPSMGNNFVMQSVIAQNQARAAALEAQAATTIVRAAKTEFAHIGSRTAIPAGQLAAQLNQMEGAVTARAFRIINSIAAKFGDALMVNVYGKLGMATGQTSTGKSINGLLGKPGGVAKSEFLTDFDKQGVNRWKTSVKAAGLKMENVTADLTVLDAGIKEYLTVVNKDVAITDATIKEAYDYSTRKMAADNKVVAAFNQLAVTAGEARVNISQSLAAKFGLQNLPTSGSKASYAVGTDKVRGNGERFPFMKSAGFNIVEVAKNAVVNGAKEALKIASPSKEMRVVGEQAGTGLILGAKETTANAANVGKEIGMAMSSSAMPTGSQARNRIALYGSGPVDADAKAIRRQLETVAKRQLAESKKQLALDEKISQSKQQLYGTTGQITQDMRNQRRLAESQAKALRVASAQRIGAEEEYAASTRRNRFQEWIASKRKVQATEASAGTMTGKIGGGLMAASMVAMMGSMMGGKIGEISQKLMMPLMAMSMIVPMLGSKFGMLGVGVAALTAAVVANRMAFDHAQDTTMQFAEAMGTGAVALDLLSKAAGKVSATDIMDRRRSNQFAPLQVATGKSTFGETFVQSDAGKALMKSVGQDIKTKGSAGAKGDLTSQLATAVTSGSMTLAQARSAAADMGKQLGDMSIGIDVNANLVKMFGPNGENLQNQPLELRANLITNSIKNVNQAAANSKSALSAGNKTADFGRNLVGTVGGEVLGMGAGVAVGAMAAAAAGAAAGSAIPVIGTAIGGLIGAGVGFFISERAKSKRIGMASGANVSADKTAMEQSVQMLDSLDLEYQSRIDSAHAAGDLTKELALQQEYEKNKTLLLEKQGALGRTILSNFKSQSGDMQGAMLTGSYKAITKKYKGTAQEDTAALAADKLKGSGFSKEKQYVISMKLASGEFSPQTINNLFEKFGNDSKVFNSVLQLSYKFGGKFADQAMSLTSMMTKGEAAKLIVDLQAKNPKEAEKYLNFMGGISGYGVINEVKVAFDFLQKNPTEAQRLMDFQDQVTKVKGKMDLKIAGSITGMTPEEMDLLKKNADYFAGLPAEQQKTFLTVLSTQMTFHGDPAYIKLYKNWLSEGNTGTIADFDIWNAKHVTDASKGITTTALNSQTPASTQGPTASPLDDLIKKIRDLRKDQQGLTVGWTASMKAMNALFTNAKGKVQNLVPGKGQSPFNGLSNQLRSKGMGEGAIDFLTGLSPEDYKKVGPKFIEIDKKTGEVRLKNAKQLNALINNIAVGEFQNSSEKMIKNLNNQDVALKKLIGSGMSVPDAYAAVADEAFAAAIATGNFTSAQVKQMIATRAQATLLTDLQERLKAVRNYFNDLTSGLQDQKTFSNLAGYLKESGMDASMIAQILSDPTLAKGMADQLARGKLDAASIADSIAKIKATTQEKIVTDLKSGNYASAFQPGYDAAQKMFDLQQRTLEQAYRPIIKADEERIKDAQTLVKLKQGELDAQQKNVDAANAEVDAANKLIDAENIKNDKLSHDIKLIDHAAEAINARYDSQKKALEEIASVNDYIIAQQGKQLGLADALTQGDIGAAAKAVQDMRAASASNSISSQQKALDNAQQNEIANLKNNNGQTKAQIEAEQYAISEKIYGIQQGQLLIAQQHLDAANAVMDTLNLQMKACEYNLTLAQEQLTTDQDDLARKIEALTVMGQTKTQWEDMKLAVEKAQMAQDELAATQLAGALATAKIVDDVWAGIKANYDSYKDKTVTITTIVNTIYTSSGGGSNGSGSTDTSAADKAAADKAAADAKAKADTGKTVEDAKLSALASQGAGASGGFSSVVAAAMLGSTNQSKSMDVIANIRAANGGYLSSGGIVPKYFTVGGYAKGTDTIPAMLTPGEFVMSKYAVDQHGVGTLSAMNDGKEVGNSVYTYNLSVNVKSDANPNEIAQVVMTQIKQIDAQKIRGVRR
jgi:phosphoribosylcarboxyaminoimidazole (NCAIR) mutase